MAIKRQPSCFWFMQQPSPAGGSAQDDAI